MVASCAKLTGRYPIHVPHHLLVQKQVCRLAGPRRPTREPYPRLGKSAHRGSPGGREPPLSKGVSPYCRTWKDHAKHCPCLVNTYSRPVAFFPIACKSFSFDPGPGFATRVWKVWWSFEAQCLLEHWEVRVQMSWQGAAVCRVC